MESTPKNKGTKKSLLMRFKPVMGIDGCYPLPVPKRNAGDPVLSYLAAADKDGAVLPAMLSSMFGPAGECGTHRRNWRAIRAALNETSLMRMVIKRRKANKGKLSLSRSISNLEETSGNKISNPKCKSTCRTISNVSSTYGCSSALTSSSLISSSIPSVRTVSSSSTHPLSIPLNGTRVKKQKQRGVVERKKGHYGSNIALFCMLSITLLILILCGKFLAILFTSMLLYLVPRSQRRPCNEGGLCGESSEFESVQNKKVAIMEGVLGSERGNNCVSLVSYRSM